MEDQGNKIIRIGNTNYLSCVKWGAVVPTKEISKRIQQITKENNAKIGIACKFKDSAMVGFIEGNKKPKHQLASVYLANANANEYAKNLSSSENGNEKSLAWICVQLLDSNQYWIGSALNGLPFADDVVVDDIDVKNKIEELINLINIQTIEEKNISIFVKNEDMNATLSREFNENSEVYFSDRDFEQIIIDTKYQIIIKQQASLLSALLLVGAVVGLTFGAIKGYEWYEQRMLEEGQLFAESEQERMKREDLMKRQKDFEDKKVEIIEKAKESIKKELNEKMTTSSSHNLIQAWANLIGRETLVITGWDRGDISCAINTETRKVFCDYILTRNINGTIKNIKDYYANLGISEIVIDEKGDKAVVRIVSDKELDFVQGDYLSLNNFDYDAFRYKTFSDLQRLALNGVSKDITEPVLYSLPIDIPQAPEGVNQPEIKEKLNLGIAEGTYVLKGKDFYKLKGMSYKLDKFEQPLYLKSLDYKYNNGEWQLKGYFFVEDAKNKGGNLDKIKIPKSEIINNKGQ